MGMQSSDSRRDAVGFPEGGSYNDVILSLALRKRFQTGVLGPSSWIADQRVSWPFWFQTGIFGPLYVAWNQLLVLIPCEFICASKLTNLFLVMNREGASLY